MHLGQIIEERKKKVDTSCRSGIGSNQVYVPSLWHYDLFNFLGDQETPRQSSSNLNDKKVSIRI